MLQTNKQVFIKSLRLTAYFNIINIIFGGVYLFFFIKKIEINEFLNLLGNLTLVESMCMLIYGSLIDFSHTAKWFSTIQLLQISKKEWDPQEAQIAGKKALTYIIVGFLLFIQMILLAFI